MLHIVYKHRWDDDVAYNKCLHAVITKKDDRNLVISEGTQYTKF